MFFSDILYAFSSINHEAFNLKLEPYHKNKKYDWKSVSIVPKKVIKC